MPTTYVSTGVFLDMPSFIRNAPFQTLGIKRHTLVLKFSSINLIRNDQFQNLKVLKTYVSTCIFVDIPSLGNAPN